jgi:hypothetical protein
VFPLCSHPASATQTQRRQQTTGWADSFGLTRGSSFAHPTGTTSTALSDENERYRCGTALSDENELHRQAALSDENERYGACDVSRQSATGCHLGYNLSKGCGSSTLCTTSTPDAALSDENERYRYNAALSDENELRCQVALSDENERLAYIVGQTRRGTT